MSMQNHPCHLHQLEQQCPLLQQYTSHQMMIMVVLCDSNGGVAPHRSMKLHVALQNHLMK